MKNGCLFGMVVGLMVGAISVGLYKPAQKVIESSAQAIKKEAKSMMNNKNSQSE